jgi:hypothetical protein
MIQQVKQKRIYLLEIDSIFSFGALGGMKANHLPLFSLLNTTLKEILLI